MKLGDWEFEFTADGKLSSVKNDEPVFRGTSDAEWRTLRDRINADIDAGRISKDPYRWIVEVDFVDRRESYLGGAWNGAVRNWSDEEWLDMVARHPSAHP